MPGQKNDCAVVSECAFEPCLRIFRIQPFHVEIFAVEISLGFGRPHSVVCQDVVDRKATAILTSHSLRELEDTCDQLALLHKGGLVLESDIGNLKTSLFKVQVAFTGEFAGTYGRNTFSDLNILHYAKHGSVANIIVRGDKAEVTAKIQAKHPVILDILPLTLEEVFTYEMEALGYSFDDVLINN